MRWLASERWLFWHATPDLHLSRTPLPIGVPLATLLAQPIWFAAERRLAQTACGSRVSLIAASTGGVLWSETFSASGGQIFDMQEEIARRVVNRLVARLDDAGLKQATPKPPDSLAAYELLLRGLARLRGYAAEDNEAARALFQAAVDEGSGLRPGAFLHRTYRSHYRWLPMHLRRCSLKLIERTSAR